jgi:dihydroneopterin aldolase
MRHVFVRNLDLEMEIGVYSHEKGRTQKARINLDLSVRDTPVDDNDLTTVVDYVAVVDKIRAHALSGHVHLVESLAERVAAICLEDPRVLRARVRVDKLEAIAEAESAGVEIERSRQALP